MLGVDQSANDEADKPVVTKAITLEVTPEQASAISLGQSVGTITLTLRHVADDTPLTQKVMDVRDLGPGPKKSSGPAAPQIRVVRGTDASHFSFGGATSSGAIEERRGKRCNEFEKQYGSGAWARRRERFCGGEGAMIMSTSNSRWPPWALPSVSLSCRA